MPKPPTYDRWIRPARRWTRWGTCRRKCRRVSWPREMDRFRSSRLCPVDTSLLWSCRASCDFRAQKAFFWNFTYRNFQLSEYIDLQSLSPKICSESLIFRFAQNQRRLTDTSKFRNSWNFKNACICYFQSKIIHNAHCALSHKLHNS